MTWSRCGMREVFVNRDDPDEEEGVEGEDDEHGHLHHPQVAGFVLHEEAGGGLIQNTLWKEGLL